MAITLAVDAMGGDFGPCVTVPAALSILRENPRLIVILVGQEALIQPYLKDLNPPLASRVSIVHTDEMVTMDDKVAVALRNKRHSSMRLAINLVHEKKALLPDQKVVISERAWRTYGSRSFLQVA